MSNVLDPATGALLLSELSRIRPHATEAEVTAALAGNELKREDSGHAWKWLRIRDLKVGDAYFIFGFGFENDRLTMVTFVVSATPIGNPSWDDWNETIERGLAVTYDEWLTSQVGEARSFAWGDVSASYDPRSAGSSIGIRYR